MPIGRIFLRPAQKVIDLLTSLIDWVYPPQCRVCGNQAEKTPFLCERCFQQLQIFDRAPDSADYHTDRPAEHVKAFYLFDESLQKLIHEIKYQDASYIASFFGEEMGRYYQDTEISRCEVLVPVPLYSVRKRERTYNQSACLAHGIAKVWNIPVEKHLVKRCRNTGTQTKLNKEERQLNIQQAFKVKRVDAIPGSVCIVDDVFTTGATTMELARTLKKAGVKTIHILCLATPPHR